MALSGCHCGLVLAPGSGLGDGRDRGQRVGGTGPTHGGSEPRPDTGLLHHSDRGSEFTSERYQAALREQGIQVSMSRTGNCWDNAAMESFFATLTKEWLTRRRFRTRQEARTAIFEYIECFYNPICLHSALQYTRPVSFEQAHETSES